MSSDYSDIRVVVGLDFGTTYSGFTYCHISDEKNPVTNAQWTDNIGQLKTNTALQYDENYVDVESWGHPAKTCRQPQTRTTSRL
ncbi:unnamed protein product [Rhizophagus irregularis]|uniref:Hsp70 family protein n=1 Tax=Rhizophagus irregularis TaxID=588596 RepID=A0A915ZLA0_9GLOM|nr:unnamed protein product [Rhizophagus irregularis]